MIHGTIILESLRPDATITGFRFVVREIGRGRPKLSPQQAAAGIPGVWSEIQFELEEEKAGELAETLSRTLDTLGWYANFSSETETYVIFPGRVFRYSRGDPQHRAEAQAHGRALGIPEHQLDWTE
jgi:hypothetical protein